MTDPRPSAVMRRIERLGAVWHVGLAAGYLLAVGFHLWCVYEHARVGFRSDR